MPIGIGIPPSPKPAPSPTGPPPSTGGGAWTQGPNGSWTWVPGAKPNPALAQQYGSATLTNITRNPDGQLNTGSWYQTPLAWKWVPGATPDPSLVGTYGGTELTNPKHTPDGVINRDPNADSGPGAWEPQSLSGTWQWAWGMPPDPNLDPKGFTTAQLTNPNQEPDGSMGPGNPASPDYPPENNVVPPTVTDIWGNTGPDVTGAAPTGTPAGGAGAGASAPPLIPAYKVSPGGIRDAENILLQELNTNQIPSYDSLKDYVAQTPSQPLYSAGMPEAQLSSLQDNVLQQIGDGLGVVGKYAAMFNNAAQNYAHADIGSFIPGS